jgi:transcriptional regulator GlxA family with amidase domain
MRIVGQETVFTPMPTDDVQTSTPQTATRLPYERLTAASPEHLPLKPALSVAEIAERTGYSRQTVTRMFECEPGVLIIERPETRNKRSYRSLRIPRHVYERVVRKIAI